MGIHGTQLWREHLNPVGAVAQQARMIGLECIHGFAGRRVAGASRGRGGLEGVARATGNIVLPMDMCP